MPKPNLGRPVLEAVRYTKYQLARLPYSIKGAGAGLTAGAGLHDLVESVLSQALEVATHANLNSDERHVLGLVAAEAIFGITGTVMGKFRDDDLQYIEDAQQAFAEITEEIIELGGEESFSPQRVYDNKVKAYLSRIRGGLAHLGSGHVEKIKHLTTVDEQETALKQDPEFKHRRDYRIKYKLGLVGGAIIGAMGGYELLQGLYALDPLLFGVDPRDPELGMKALATIGAGFQGARVGKNIPETTLKVDLAAADLEHAKSVRSNLIRRGARRSNVGEPDQPNGTYGRGRYDDDEGALAR